MKRELLYFHQISKRIGRLTVLDNIELRIYKGDITLLLGPSGSGKTVLNQIASGQMQPDSGFLYFNEKPLKLSSYQMAVRKGIQYVSQMTRLMENLSIGENIFIGSHKFLHGLHFVRDNNLLVSDFCKSVGLSINACKSARKLPFIDLLTVISARALYKKSQLVIFDEVITPLSDEERRKFSMIIKLLIKNGISIMMTESTITETVNLADRILFLKNGRLHFDQSRNEANWDLIRKSFTEDKRITLKGVIETSNNSQHNDLCFFDRTLKMRKISIKEGEIVSLAYQNLEDYNWFLRNAFSIESLRACNQQHRKTERPLYVLLTPDMWHGSVFPYLSVAENILLPAIGQLFNSSHLVKKDIATFAYQEFKDVLQINLEDFKEPMRHFGRLEIESVILSRILVLNPHIIVMAGLFEEPDIRMQEKLERFVGTVAKKGWAVLIIDSSIEFVSHFTHRMLEVDNPQINEHDEEIYKITNK